MPQRCLNCICAPSYPRVQLKGALTPSTEPHSSGVGQGLPPPKVAVPGSCCRRDCNGRGRAGGENWTGPMGKPRCGSEKGCGAGGEGHGVGLGGPWAASQGAAASQSGKRFGSVAGGFMARL